MSSRTLSQTSSSTTHYFFPAERSPHAGTMMAWPTKGSMGKFDDISATRREVTSIAETISRYEPLHLFTFNDSNNVDTARALLGGNSNISIHPIARLDSLWARDTGPLFVRFKFDESVSGLTLNFNNWGNKFEGPGDCLTASCALHELNVQGLTANFVSEGGALEFDGEGTLLATESSILNINRNPGKSKADLEAEFRRAFDITKTIWLKGVKGHDSTDYHIDALARFVSPGLVVLTRPSSSHSQAEKDTYADAKTRLEKEMDAKGRSIRVVEIPEPEYARFKGQFVCSYVNYYVVNGAVIAPMFGDEKADEEAKRLLGELFPERAVEQVLLKHLPAQGGGIHCATQQILGSTCIVE